MRYASRDGVAPPVSGKIFLGAHSGLTGPVPQDEILAAAQGMARVSTSRPAIADFIPCFLLCRHISLPISADRVGIRGVTGGERCGLGADD